MPNGATFALTDSTTNQVTSYALASTSAGTTFIEKASPCSGHRKARNTHVPPDAEAQ